MIVDDMDKGDKAPCFFCKKEVSRENFCFGCKQVICDGCETNGQAMGHGHDVEDHRREPEEW